MPPMPLCSLEPHDPLDPLLGMLLATSPNNAHPLISRECQYSHQVMISSRGIWSNYYMSVIISISQVLKSAKNIISGQQIHQKAMHEMFKTPFCGTKVWITALPSTQNPISSHFSNNFLYPHSSWDDPRLPSAWCIKWYLPYLAASQLPPAPSPWI